MGYRQVVRAVAAAMLISIGLAACAMPKSNGLDARALEDSHEDEMPGLFTGKKGKYTFTIK